MELALYYERTADRIIEQHDICQVKQGIAYPDKRIIQFHAPFGGEKQVICPETDRNQVMGERCGNILQIIQVVQSQVFRPDHKMVHQEGQGYADNGQSP